MLVIRMIVLIPTVVFFTYHPNEAKGNDNEQLFQTKTVVAIKILGLPDTSEEYCNLELSNPMVPPFNDLTRAVQTHWSTIFSMIGLAEQEFRTNNEDPYVNTNKAGVMRGLAMENAEKKLSIIWEIAGPAGHDLAAYVTDTFYACRDFLIDESIISFSVPVLGR
jgi:hypothetical protein